MTSSDHTTIEISDIKVCPTVFVPKGFNYKDIKHEEQNNKTEFVVNITSTDEFKSWKKNFEALNKECFSLRDSNKGKKHYKSMRLYICHHNERCRKRKYQPTEREFIDGVEG